MRDLGPWLTALFFYRARLSPTRIFAAKLTVNVTLNIILTPLALSWMYGKSIMVYLIPRIAKNLLIFPLEAVLLMLFSGRYAAGAAPPGSAYRRTAGAEAHQTAYRGFGRDVPDCDRGGFGVLPLLLRCKITCRAVYGCVSLCKITLENDVFLC